MFRKCRKSVKSLSCESLGKTLRSKSAKLYYENNFENLAYCLVNFEFVF